MSRALPSVFKEGVYRVPNTLLIEIDDYLGRRKLQRQALVIEFQATYDERVTEALERLGDIGNADDYLDAGEAASKFGLEWKYVSFNTPDTLKNLKAGLFERERQKIEKMMAEATEEIRTVLRAQMSALVKRMVTQLAPGKDGKRKKIYDSLTGNIEDFLSTFDARNLANDGELQRLVATAREAMNGINPDVLRNDDEARSEVAKDFAKINATLDEMIIETPTRRFDFSD